MRLTVSADTPVALQVTMGKRLTKRPGDSPTRRVAQAEPGASPDGGNTVPSLSRKGRKVYRLSKATLGWKQKWAPRKNKPRKR